ncbi:MAG TPA: HlyD family secretion protein [Rhizomicrobium sp.]|jgi:membrane fusion protein (multidrug efflux system)
MASEGHNGDRGADTPHQRDKDPDDQEDRDDAGNEKTKSPFAKPWVKIALVLSVLLLVTGGVIWWLIARHYEDTDDAFIDTHIIHVAPQISGQVLVVDVNDNQFVRAGQPLLQIDARNQTAQLEQTQAQRLQALTQIEQAQAQERAALAQLTNASRDLARYHILQKTSPQAVAQQQVDQAEAAAKNAAAQRDQATAQIAGSRAQIKVLDAQIATAELQLSYARVVAPVDGHVTQRSVAPGNYVSPGQEMMAIVPSQLWVTANFKETQLALMRRGQHVRVLVDSCNREIDGHIDSIQRGAGQAFGILPPQNATGNYVKVVQRVPVKILLDHTPPDCILGPGMSVEPTVTVR